MIDIIRDASNIEINRWGGDWESGCRNLGKIMRVLFATISLDQLESHKDFLFDGNLLSKVFTA